ncbi:MAG: DnaJ domain-containing protein [Bacteroidia bacterium]|nr:DnaJ domain-containing protein [Bacteroidia bacterium]
MFKDYYDILGVDRNASERDIKRSFRSLAMIYHPDSNENPEAHQKFLDINEAYQTLGDEVKRKTYNDRYEYHKFVKFSEQIKPDYTYTTAYNPPVWQTPPPGPTRYEEFSRYNFFARFSAWVGFLFALSIVVDYFFANYSDIEMVRTMSITQGPGGELSGFVHTDSMGFLLDYKHFEHLGKGDKINLRKTPFYNVITHLYVWEFPQSSENIPVQNGPQSYSPETMIQVFSFSPHYGIYNVFSFFLIGLFLSGVVGISLQHRPEFLFKLGLLNILLTLISLFVLVNS